MDKISREDLHKKIEEWNKQSLTQTISSQQPAFTYTPTSNGTYVPAFTYTFKQYDEIDALIFLYNRLVDEINDIKNSQKHT